MIRFFDMFAGIGGFRSGLEKAGGFKCVGYCEINKYARMSYEAMYDTEGEVYFDDARKIVPEELPDIDLICGGFPCQTFSRAGARRGFDDARGTLFFEIARIAAVKKPEYLLLENVPGLLDHDGGRTFKTILGTLERMGYDVAWSVTGQLLALHSSGKECSLSDIIERGAKEEYCLSEKQLGGLIVKR